MSRRNPHILNGTPLENTTEVPLAVGFALRALVEVVNHANIPASDQPAVQVVVAQLRGGFAGIGGIRASRYPAVDASLVARARAPPAS
jgi:hypothetical protein